MVLVESGVISPEREAECPITYVSGNSFGGKTYTVEQRIEDIEMALALCYSEVVDHSKLMDVARRYTEYMQIKYRK
jgi:hypothetical protein